MSPRFVAQTLVVSALGLIALVSSSCGAAVNSANSAQAAMPPPEVEVLPVTEETVQLHSEWVATIDGQVNAQIQPQVSGYVIQQNYREGQFVLKGQVLFVIDPRPFEAIVEQQRGMLAQAESQVTQAESQVLQSESQAAQAMAQLKKAQLDVKRDTPLAQAHAIPQSQLDTEVQAQAAAEAALQAAKANIAASQAAVKTAKAAVMSARANLAQGELNLGFTQVRSLIDGIAGVAQTQIGNLVKTDTVLTTVSQVDPVRVYFPISEREYMDLAGKSKSDAVGNLLNSPKAPTLELILTNGATFPHKGRVAFADRQVDAQTGTIRLAATFPNPGNVLRPGQFGRVRALTQQQEGALLIPQRAVTELQGKFQVAVVGAGNKVQLRTVTLGPILDSRYLVESGLRAGDKVVVEGLAKAMDGAVVNPKPARASLAKPSVQGL
jgi:membrane fusion protein (multidrug efflux system)